MEEDPQAGRHHPGPEVQEPSGGRLSLGWPHRVAQGRGAVHQRPDSQGHGRQFLGQPVPPQEAPAGPGQRPGLVAGQGSRISSELQVARAAEPGSLRPADRKPDGPGRGPGREAGRSAAAPRAHGLRRAAAGAGARAGARRRRWSVGRRRCRGAKPSAGRRGARAAGRRAGGPACASPTARRLRPAALGHGACARTQRGRRGRRQEAGALRPGPARPGRGFLSAPGSSQPHVLHAAPALRLAAGGGPAPGRERADHDPGAGRGGEVGY